MFPSIIKNPFSEDKKYTAFALIRLSEEQYSKTLFERGQIFCRSIQEIRSGEDDHRFDSYEGASEVIAEGPGVLTIKHPDIGELNLNVTQASYKMDYESVFGNICCFYSLTERNFYGRKPFIRIDEKISEFGTHAVIIKDVGEFKRRIYKKAQELGIKMYLGLVDYYDHYDYKGNVNIFQKRKEYSYQFEARLFVKREAMDSYTFEIGSIQDIAEIITAKELLEKEIHARYKPILKLPES